MAKWLCISPTNSTLVIECTGGAVAHQAREYAALQFTRDAKGIPVAPQSVLVTETGNDAREDVRIRMVGNASGTPSTLRLEAQRKIGKTKWSEWEVM